MIQVVESGDCLEVAEIQLLPERQRRGIGTRLLADVIDRAAAQRKDVTLSTGLMNAGAHRLYRRLGFEEVERSDTHVHFRYHASEP